MSKERSYLKTKSLPKLKQALENVILADSYRRKLNSTSRTNHNIKRVQIILMRNIRIILLTLHRILREDTAFQRNCGRCPVITRHRISERDNQIKLTDIHQTAIGRTQHLLRGIIHCDGCRIGQIPKPT